MSTTSGSTTKTFSAEPAEPSSADAARKRPSARDRVFAAATALFYRRGIGAVSVDSIAQEAGTTKMSLYRAFPGKNDLVAECLQESNASFWRWWDETTAPYADQPRAALMALFDAITAKANTCESRGCVIGNAAVEITDDSHPARKIVVAFNEEKRRRLHALSVQLGASDAGALADGLMLLLEGSYLSRLSLGAAGPSAGLSRAAVALVDAYCPNRL